MLKDLFRYLVYAMARWEAFGCTVSFESTNSLQLLCRIRFLIRHYCGRFYLEDSILACLSCLIIILLLSHGLCPGCCMNSSILKSLA
jgi:hypothetical protein